MTSEGMRRRVSSTPDGIGLSTAFFDEVVIEQAHGDEALLKGGVGEPDTRINSDNIRTAPIESDRKIADVPWISARPAVSGSVRSRWQTER
jgi:hypothetical protein